MRMKCRSYMFRRRTYAVLRELKVPDKICLRYVMGEDGACTVPKHVGAALIF
jgi:hypothetical protein